MNGSSDLSQSPEYLSFRSYIPLKRIVVDTDNTKASYNEIFPHNINNVFLGMENL